ncbi:glutamate--tRNA ligase [Candidatus Woesearchaeota archaeon]|nr:glutamate--tRNA ligase [Candidatus Woesearchaeota archaeon]
MVALDTLIKKAALANAYSHEGAAQVGAVLGQILAIEPKLKENIPETKKLVAKIVSEVNKLKLDAQKKEIERIYPEYFKPKEKPAPKELPELPNAQKGKVIMRFEPSPSGPLHIGHAYTLGLNSEYCRKYKGKLILRISDTNPLNIFTPAYKMIPKDAKWVTKNNINKISLQSKRIKSYYKVAEELLKTSYAYVCSCDPEDWKDLMIKSEACPCRDLHPVEQLERWRAMLKGDIKEGDAVVRIKTDLSHKNPAMRDWPALRILDAKHPKVGKKYRVWPLMNFAVAVDDYEMGITHAIRMKEHRDNEKRQKFIYDYLDWKMPTHLYVGAINFKDLKLSATKTRQAIKAGKFSSWRDVQLPFLSAMKRRGYLPETFIKYSIQVGPSEADKTVTKKEFFELFDAINRELLDPIANRYFFVAEPKKIDIKNAPKLNATTAPVHPDKKKRRKINVGKNIWIAKEDFKKFRNKEVRLLDLYNIKLNKKSRFTSKENKDIPRIQWVSDDYVQTEILMPSGKSIEGFAEHNIKNLKEGDIIQFMRFGFCKLDRKKRNKIIFAFAHR